MNREALKTRAKQQLGGGIFQSEWLNGVLYTFVASLLSSVGSIITYGPVSYALSKTFLRKARYNEKLDISGVIDGFKDDFGGTFLLGLLETIFISLWSLLFVIPGIIKAYAYSFAFYIKADHPEYDWKQCLDESCRMTDGHKGELFMLDLSFFGWLFVGSLVCGVGTLWVSPYIYMTKTNYYLELCGQTAAPYGAPYGNPYAPQTPPAAPYQTAPQQTPYQTAPQQTPYQAAPQQYQPPQQPAYQPPQQPATSPDWQRPNVNPYSHQGPVGASAPQQVPYQAPQQATPPAIDPPQDEN